jgi:hypothetical protein
MYRCPEHRGPRPQSFAVISSRANDDDDDNVTIIIIIYTDAAAEEMCGFNCPGRLNIAIYYAHADVVYNSNSSACRNTAKTRTRGKNDAYIT